MDLLCLGISWKSIAMTNKELLQADLLDILFERRNKAYGAYDLRRYYNTRLTLAVTLAMALAATLFLVTFWTAGRLTADIRTESTSKPVITTYVAVKPLEQPVAGAHTAAHPVKQTDFRVFKLVKDNVQIKPIATQNQLEIPAISGLDRDGPGLPAPGEIKSGSTGDSGGTVFKDTKPDVHPVLSTTAPTFPGGLGALGKFFSRTLRAPDELQPGEKRIVLVRFIVQADGSISKTEIIQSAGEAFDQEVLRAFKRMPRWNPALQNGIRVAVSFTQPVTFVALEP